MTEDHHEPWSEHRPEKEPAPFGVELDSGAGLVGLTEDEAHELADITGGRIITEPAELTQEEKIKRFAALLLEQHNAELARRGYNWTETVKVHPRKLYTLVDVGPEHNMSGRYMVEHETGIIYGIKGYGRVHKGHRYGTLDTVADWDWGGYTARPRGGTYTKNYPVELP